MYKTPTCGTCAGVITRFEKEGLPLTVVDVSENPEKLAELKERLGSPTFRAPTFEWNGQLGSIVDLRGFEAELRAELVAA
jgi:glutaredoxin